MELSNDFQILLHTLARIEAKVDTQTAQMGRINERLAKLESKMEGQDAYNSKVDELWSLRERGTGMRQILGWIVTGAMGLGGLLMGLFK